MEKNNFKKFGICSDIVRSLNYLNLKTPTPIQDKVIPHILKGKNVLVKAPTGTGKTASFVIPLLELNKDIKRINKPFILVISPTRELTIQISDNFKKISKNLNFKVASFVGGVNESPQLRQIKQGVDIVVATPGRLCDFIRNKRIDLSYVSHFVLDEVDLILDMGFIKDINFIYNSLNKNIQTIFLSATIPFEIEKLASKMLGKYIREEVKSEKENKPLINQTVFYINKNNKRDLLLQMIKRSPNSTFIIFSNYKKRADEISNFLYSQKIRSKVLHGDKDQRIRQKAINDFKNKTINVLIATDVAARGIHIDNVNYVINYDIPNNADVYTHRMGRTGRANQYGECYNICEYDDFPFMQEIIKKQKEEIKVFLNEEKWFSQNIIFHDSFNKKWLIEKDNRVSKRNEFKPTTNRKNKNKKTFKPKQTSIVLSQDFANEKGNWKEQPKKKNKKSFSNNKKNFSKNNNRRNFKRNKK